MGLLAVVVLVLFISATSQLRTLLQQHGLPCTPALLPTPVAKVSRLFREADHGRADDGAAFAADDAEMQRPLPLRAEQSAPSVSSSSQDAFSEGASSRGSSPQITHKAAASAPRAAARAAALARAARAQRPATAPAPAPQSAQPASGYSIDLAGDDWDESI